MKPMQFPVFYLFLALVYLGSYTPVQAASLNDLRSEFQDILNKDAFAHKGPGVDYLKLAAKVDDLKKHVDKYNSLKITKTTSDAEKKAAYFNLYNAATLLTITKNLAAKLGSKKGSARQKAYERWASKAKMNGLFGVKPWKTAVKLAGVSLTIDEIEHGLLRRDAKRAAHKKSWDPLVVKSLDARLHAAVNCGAIDCPPINKTAYSARTLDSALNKNMTKFLMNKFYLAKGFMFGSSIVFEWYLNDFVAAAGGKAKVGAYLSGFLTPRMEDLKKKDKRSNSEERLLKNLVVITDFFAANPTITSSKYKHSYNWLVNDRTNFK